MIDSNHNNTEVPADLSEEQASQPIVKVFAARSKAKAKPQRREPVDLPSIIPMNKRKWIDIGPGDSSLSAYEVSMKVISLLRHKQYSGKTMEQFNSIELNFIFEIIPHKYSIGLMIVGRHAWQQEEEEQKGDISSALISQEQLFISELFKDIQDNVIIQSGFFQHIYQIGCAFNLHSIINNGLILGGHNSSKRQTVFFLLVDPRDKGHQDPAKIDFTVPRRAQYLQQCLEETSRRGVLG